MSDPGAPPPPPPTGYQYGAPPAGPAPMKQSRTPFVIISLVLFLAITGLGTAAFVVFNDDSRGTAVNESEKGIDFPKEWDRRILPFVKIAEDERDLEFKHPVEVRFLTEKEFVEDAKSDQELTDEDRKEIAQNTSLLRAVGLVSGDLDLVKALEDFYEVGTLAYYSTKEKVVTVRGTEITPALKSTLVHELVHVLQDQHFDIGTRTADLQEDAEDGETANNEASVLDAVIEGDAKRIEAQYRQSLSAKEREALDKSERAQSEQGSDGYADIPDIIVALQLAPYTLGEQVVAAVAQDAGNRGVNKLFTDTPKHEAALLDAFEVIAGDTDALDIATPALADGEEKFDIGEFGSLTLYIMLAERIDLKEALNAADQWGGDRYIAYEKDAKSCVRFAVQGDTAAGTEAIATALQKWIDEAPGTPSALDRSGDEVLLVSCDPGTKGPEGKDAAQQAVELVAFRTFLGLNVMKQGTPASFASCYADSVLREFTVAQVTDPGFGRDDVTQAKFRELAAGCR